MERTGSTSPYFGLRRVRSHVRVRSQHNLGPAYDVEKNFNDNGDSVKFREAGPGRRIMVVVDSMLEAKVALQWALTHSVQSQDTIVLTHVMKPCKQGGKSQEEMGPRIYKLLYSVRNICHLKRPEVQVEISLVEGKKKGPIIVEEVKKQGVSLLVLGQRKPSLMWRVVMLMCARNRTSDGVVKYCIENADCMTIAVRRKGRKLGGYLITTRQHKDFWVLA